MDGIIEGAMIGAVAGGVTAGLVALLGKLFRWGPKTANYALYAAILVAIAASRIVPMMPWWPSFRAGLLGG